MVTKQIQESIDVKTRLLEDKITVELINTVAQKCTDIYRSGRKTLLAGNGGSAADAQHIAAEFVSRFYFDRPGLPSIALTTDTSIITAISNDYGYENVFKRQIQALANEKDVVIGISTGGASKNVVNALSLASELGCKIIGFSGRDGGDMNKICDVNIVVPSQDTPRIQEMHIFIGHTICHLIDEEFTN